SGIFTAAAQIVSSAHCPRHPRLISGSSRPRRRRGSRRGGGRRSLLGDPGLAHAFENGLELGQIRRVVAHPRPGGAGAGNGEGRVERETRFNGETRLVESTKLSECGAQPKVWVRIISIGLDRPPTPRGRFLVTAEVVLRPACGTHPDVGPRIARTEAQGLSNVSLCFFSAANDNLTKTDSGMGVGEISIQLQRVFTFGDALCGALGQYIDMSQPPM